MMEGIKDLKQLLSSPKDIVIISHRNPDGDAIGSSYGLKYFLERKFHKVQVIFPSEYPPLFNFLSDIDQAIVYDTDQSTAANAIKQAEVIFCLDFNGLDRIDKLGPKVDESEAKKVLIDHHLFPEQFADFVLSETEASSTCELIYKFIDQLEESNLVDKKISESLFIGLITDTGSFRYSTRAYTYEVAAMLKNKGADDYFIQDKIFNSQQEKHLRLLGHCLANRMELIPEYGAGIIHLTRDDYKQFKIARGDTEGIVNHILMIKNIDVAAFITEQPTIIKLSLRSKGDISVQEIARNHFNGGGHKNASGGSAYAKLEDVINRFKSVLPKYIQKQDIS
jgi:phosphoesterase RecJ-like protein